MHAKTLLLISMLFVTGCAAGLTRVGPAKHGVNRDRTTITGSDATYVYLANENYDDEQRPFGVSLGIRPGFGISTTPQGSGRGLSGDFGATFVYAFGNYAAALYGGFATQSVGIDAHRSVQLLGFPVEAEFHYGLGSRLSVYGAAGLWLGSGINTKYDNVTELSSDATTLRARGGLLLTLRQGTGDEWDILLRTEARLLHASGGPLAAGFSGGLQAPATAGFEVGAASSLSGVGVGLELVFVSTNM